jgi:hypothetical protein
VKKSFADQTNRLIKSNGKPEKKTPGEIPRAIHYGERYIVIKAEETNEYKKYSAETSYALGGNNYEPI